MSIVVERTMISMEFIINSVFALTMSQIAAMKGVKLSAVSTVMGIPALNVAAPIESVFMKLEQKQ